MLQVHGLFLNYKFNSRKKIDKKKSLKQTVGSRKHKEKKLRYEDRKPKKDNMEPHIKRYEDYYDDAFLDY
jgi:hypothetical protein